MAEIIDQNGRMHDVASNGKANAGLTLGIIGTALGALGTGIGGLKGILGLGCPTNVAGIMPNVTPEEMYLERKQCQDYLNTTRQFYEGQAQTTREITNGFFDAYMRDVNNSFKLYKSQRDEDDAIKAQMAANFFDLYKMEQNDKSTLTDKINEVEKKVDVISAIRPYQDALINCKIDNNAMIAAYELQKRTCRMLQGELVLPSTPVVSGYPSYSPCSFYNTSTPASGATS